VSGWRADPMARGRERSWKRAVVWLLLAVFVLGISGGALTWFKFFRTVPQEPFATPAEKFLYGSMGAEAIAGIPYPLFVALPRVFGDLMPGPGGFAAFGFAWEDGKPLPAGFSLKTVGFPRVGGNCALCHTATWRAEEDGPRHIVPAGPGHTANPQAVIRFLAAAAHDPRWSPDILLAQILVEFDLSWLDILLYRFFYIPAAQQALFLLESQFAWMEEDRPDWGPGRDDPMNLTKFNLALKDWDGTTGNADFPSIWNLDRRKGQALNWAGETLDAHAVITDSAMGLGVLPQLHLEERVQEHLAFLGPLEPPSYPFPVDQALAYAGQRVWDAECAACHSFEGELVGTIISIEKIGTDRERFDTWQQDDANKVNQIASAIGSKRNDMVKQNGYVASPLDGIWLRAPYLHNGAVPTLADLLEPPSERPRQFYRGYDVYDPVKVGFVTSGPDAQRQGTLHDTSLRGNGRGGHRYGVELLPSEKWALLEYLKTL
jgi:mono/diheme cytochrome c family protein